MQNLKFLTLKHFLLLDCQPAVRPSSTIAMVPVFSHNKGRIYETVVPKNVYPLHHGASFYPLLVSFCLQIACRKVRNLRIGVNKLLGKVLINLLHMQSQPFA